MNAKEKRKNREDNLRETRLSSGLCITCGKNPSEKDKQRCAKCIKNSNEASANFAIRNLELGYCLCNKNNPVVPGKTRCEKCLSREKQRYEKKKEKGICYLCNKNNPVLGKLACQSCSDRRSEWKKEKKKLRREQGVCERCGHQEIIINPDRISVCKKCILQRLSLEHLGTSKKWEELEQLFDKQNICPYTKIQLILGVNISIDHIIPKSRGGTNSIDNLQFVYYGDFDVNRMKGDLTNDEFISAIRVIYRGI